MDYASSLGTLGSVGLDFSHKVMVDQAFDFRSLGYIDFVLMLLKLLHLVHSDNSSLGLSPCQGDPDSSQKLPFMDF